MDRPAGFAAKAVVARCFTVLLLLGSTAFADYRDAIGFTALKAELGGKMPTGAGVTLTQVEALNDSSAYSPDSTDADFPGKTFSLKSGPTGVSGHATGVGRHVYGINIGIAPGVNDIAVYEAANYVGNGFLKAGNSMAAPVVENRRVQNHSWISTASSAQEVIRRLDFSIKRDGFVAVLGLNNSSGMDVPDLLAHSYNGISVGQSSGEHSRGGTRFDIAGRIKPDIVAPSAYEAVSFSVGVVSGAAALLLETADNSSPLANARSKPEVIKALLMAGATKSEFPNWHRTPTQPLDTTYGAGQLNIQNSYHILTAGEQPASTSTTVGLKGWHLGKSATTPARYFFEVPAGSNLTNFSAMLVWNRNVYDGNAGPVFNPLATLANLDLRLYRATDFTVGNLIDSSVGTLDNVEHVFQTQLPAGRYALEVTADLAGQDYALAWTGAEVSTSRPGLLAVSPADGLAFSGVNGGPFNPTSAAYTLTNSGDAPLNWVATNSQTWVGVSASAGTLMPGASTTLTVSLASNASALPVGTYMNTLLIADTVDGTVPQSRNIALTVASSAFSLTGSISAGQFQITLNGQPGSAYAVEGSSDLMQWTGMVTNSTGSDGSLTINDPISGRSTRYYRARLNP